MRTTLFTAAAAAAALAFFAAPTPKSVDAAALPPSIGKTAPEFEGATIDGDTISLADYRGKTVVLEWTNHDCPYVRRHYTSGNMQSVQRDATGEGIVWISIISSAPGEQGHVTPEQAKQINIERDVAVTEQILDPEGKIGRLYGARTTPHMYVIDPEGTLRYMGAIDDKPWANEQETLNATNYVRKALAAMQAEAEIDPAITKAYGCTVKYIN